MRTALSLIALAAACDRVAPPPAAAPAPPAVAPALPPGHPPGDPGGVTADPHAALDPHASLDPHGVPARGAGPSVVFDAPPGWTAQAPTSSMRAAQLRVPRAPGDGEDAEVVVFWFGGGGGSVEANLERWYGQFTRPDGKASRDAAKVTTSGATGLGVTRVEIDGTYAAGMMPGSDGRSHPNWRMIAAVVQTPSGPVFARLLGPDASVRAAAADFDAYVASVRAK
jgi:hypothetical protein